MEVNRIWLRSFNCVELIQTRHSNMSCIVNQLAQVLVRVQQDEGLKKDFLVVGLVDSFALVVITTVAYFYYRWWSRHPLYGRNKGLKIYPIVGSMIPILKNRHRMMDFHYDILKKIPGHTYRAVRPGGINVYVTANPTNVEHVLKTNFENYPKGQLLNRNLGELLGDGIFNVDDHLWKVQRKVASYEFTTRSLRDFVLESAARETADRLVPFLYHASQSGQVFNLQDIFARFAFDNICQLGFGVDPACLDISLPRVRFAEAFDKATFLSAKHMQSFPRFMWDVKRAFNVGQPKELRLAVAEIDEFAMRVIKNRRQELAASSARGDRETLGGRSDLLSRFMTLVGNEEQGREIRAELSNQEGKSMEDQKFKRKNNSNDVFLRDIIISFVLAGRDTTTSALSSFFWLLSSHPNVETAILDEISQVLSSRPPAAGESCGADEISSGKSSSPFSFEELKGMHYVHAALAECVRLYPPVPADVKTSRRADVWPDGTVIKANSLIVYHPYAMGRLEDLWGKDALQFKPERWLKDGMFVPQSPYKYSAFQAGPRTCLGKDMVMLQMKLVCATILRNFEICVPKDYEPQHVTTLTLRMKNGLPVTVRKRTST